MFVAMLTIACSLVGKAAEGDTYKLVTDASELKSGDIVVIASKNKAVAKPKSTLPNAMDTKDNMAKAIIT